MRVTEIQDLLNAGRPTAVVDAVRMAAADDPDTATQVQLALLAGNALFEQGRVTDGMNRLREALVLARDGSLAQRLAVSLSLFAKESQFQAADETVPALANLRQLAMAIGDAEALGGLHLVVARLEACRGLCIDARRHLEISRQLVGQSETPGLRIVIDLIDSGLESYAGNLRRATRSARDGAQRAQAAGLRIPLAGTLTNLGSLSLFQGQAEEAAAQLDEAISLTDDLGLVRLPALDSLAQLALFEADLAGANERLTACATMIAEHQVPARSWYDFANQLTRCAFHDAREEWEPVVVIADEADDELARRQFKALRSALLCAKARALAKLGRHGQAEAALSAAIRTCPRGAVDPLIVLEASRAVCASLRGDLATGATHFDRARAACRAIGHRYHERWIERDRASLPSQSRVSIPDAPPQPHVAATAMLLTDVATMLGAGHSVDLLAHRMAAILRGTSLGTRVEVAHESELPFDPDPTAAWEAQVDGAFSIRLRGSDRQVKIRVADVESIDEISLLKAVADILQAAVHRTADTERDDDEPNLWPRGAIEGAANTVFQSPRMVELLRIAERLASTELPVLITGETGTGKDVIARIIHDHSRARRGPFVPFNCSAVPRDLVESQLFGHRRGAFTGATEAFPGLIRAAAGGTLFLDEIGDLELSAQPKLLRFLESGEIQPVGEVRTHRVDVRIIAATNADLDERVARGEFRSDLFYRVGVARLTLPPLRDRKDEIPALASLFLTRDVRACHRPGVRLGDDFIAALLLYDWPGNIRQLSNEIRRAVAMAADGESLTAASLAPEIADTWNSRVITPPVSSGPTVSVNLDQPLASAVAELERKFIEQALLAADGRVTDAARLLGLSRKGLFLKRRRQGLIKD